MTHRPNRPSDFSDHVRDVFFNYSSDDDDSDKIEPVYDPSPSPMVILIRLSRSPRVLCTFVAMFFVIFATTGLVLLHNHIGVAWLRSSGVPPGVYSRDGLLYIGKNTPFRIKGLSWFGMEEEEHLPGGLHEKTVDEIFEFATEYKFNAVRLPLSVDNLLRNRISHSNVFINPELSGLSYIQVVKYVVQTAAKHKLLILLDAHRLKSDQIQSNGLWYSDEVTQAELDTFWKTLCKELQEEWNVLGADLYNEPWDALWNSTNVSHDWKRASERLGNDIHASCPSWLVLIQGVGPTEKSVQTNTFWAENLHVMQNAPPKLSLQSKVAISPHVYGPSVYNQTYFGDNEFPANMPDIWDDHFGKASHVTGLATVVGEWGGLFIGKDKEWQLKFFQYIQEKNMSFFYWCINPESADTGGLLKSDWKTPENDRLAMLDAAPSTRVADHVVHFKYWRGWRAG